MREIFSFLFILYAALCAAQTNYYVNGATGSNSNNGLSMATAWKTIQKACNAAPANSIVHIKGGTYHENLTLNVSGTQNNPIVFTNYLDDVVILDGGGTTGTIMLSITNKSHVTFENMSIQNLTSTYAKGISVEAGTGSCTGLTFRNLLIKDIAWTDDPNDMPGNSDNAWGLKVKGQVGGIWNLTIENCEIYGNVLGYSEAITIAGHVDGFVIKDCSIHDNTNIGIDIIGHNDSSTNPDLDWPRNGLITGNTCYRNTSPVAQSAGIYIDGAQDIVIEKNSCYDNPIGIEVGCEDDGVAQYIRVKNNLIFNNHYTGLAVGGYTTDTSGQVLFSTFRNNTFFKNNALNTGMGEITVSKASNCVFEGNIVHANNQNVLLTMLDIAPQEDNLLNYNCFYTPSGNANNIIVYWGEATYHTINAYKSGTAQESSSVYSNPGFLSTTLPAPDLALMQNSQCINKGNPALQITAGETDFEGNPRIVSNRIDIGAHEFNPALGNAHHDLQTATVSPNPFSGETLIKTTTDLDGAVLLLYDLSGRLVRTQQPTSENTILLKQGNLPSGLYFYRIVRQGNAIGSGKLVVE